MRRLILAIALLGAGAGTARAFSSEEGKLGKQAELPEGEQLAGSLDAEHPPAAHDAHELPPINFYDWHKGKDAFGGKLEEGEEPMAPGLVFALANFAIFGFILIKYAGPAVRRFTRERHESIRDALEEGARLRDQAQTKLAGYTDKIRGVEKEVDQLISDIRATAEAERQQILAQAEVQARALRTEAEQRIAAERDQARRELAHQVTLQAIAIAEKLLREKSSPADQQKQFDAFLGDLDEFAAKQVRP